MGTGALFNFVGDSGKVVGTSSWNLNTGTAYGSFVWGGKLTGTWNMNWSVRDDQSCLEPQPGKWECQLIYGYENGFFEVDSDGTIHTHTVPAKATQLDQPLTPDEAASLFVTMINWGQKIETSLVSATENDGIVSVVVADPEGRKSTFRIDAATGQLLSSN